MTHQQLQWVGGLSLLISAFCLIALVGWTQGEPDQVGRSPAILGTWHWYGGTMQVKSDGTCHWQGANREEHGTWKKADGYFFDWGEKGTDWNYLSVDSGGRLSGQFLKWGGELQGTRPEIAPEK